MKYPLLVVSLVLLLCFAFGCKQAKERAEEPVLDVEAKTEALRTLREADKSWSQSTTDLDAFMSFIVDDVAWFPPSTSRPIIGKNEVRSFFEPIFKEPGFLLSWTPDRIDVSDAGDMGYVYGSYKVTQRDSSDRPVEEIRPYVTFWKKQSSGEWKVVLEADY
jgi:ketosteroid isomerase-like protein